MVDDGQLVEDRVRGKMSLYWNDAFWFVDQLNRKKSSLRSFVRARKVFIGGIRSKQVSIASQAMNGSDCIEEMLTLQWGTPEDVRRVFRKYGSIESLEFLAEKYPIYADNDEYYAYVTYFDSMSAFRAIRDGKNIRESLRITLADTWKQPDAMVRECYAAEDGEVSLNRLNEYCLLEIFGRLDLQTLLNVSRVCERFDGLIRRRVFPRQRRISLDLRPESNQPRSLASVRDILTNVGPHATEVRLEIDMYDHPPNTVRLMDIFTRSLGESLQRLELIGAFINERLHEQLKPIFRRLKVLKWDCDHFDERGFEVDFVHWCPALEKLKLRSMMRFDINAERWPSLEAVTFNMYCFYESESYPLFFQNNGQLRRLKINVYHHFTMVNDICVRLPNLEALKIYCCEGAEARGFRQLVGLKKLKELRLSTVSFADNNPQAFMTLLGDMPTLEKLELNVEYFGSTGVYVPEHCFLAPLARKLKNLKEFYIGRYGLTEDSLLAFLRAAPQLTVLKYSECNLSLSESLMEKIVAIRKQQAGNSPQKGRPLKIFVDEDSLLLNDENDIVTVHILDKDASDFEYF